MLGLVKYSLALNTGVRSVNAVVAECNDGWLSEIDALSVKPEHVLEAIADAQDGAVSEGSVGAGTGMMCYEWKGGIGTSSRRVPAPRAGEFMIGALVLANFGHAEDLCIAGVAIGSTMLPPGRIDHHSGQTGSCVIVLATSAPLDARQLARLARRAQTGLARTGSFGEHGSGEYAIAFSTARLRARPGGMSEPAAAVDDGSSCMNALLQGVVEATEEAVVSALFGATYVRGRNDREGIPLPVGRVMDLLGHA